MVDTQDALLAVGAFLGSEALGVTDFTPVGSSGKQEDENKQDSPITSLPRLSIPDLAPALTGLQSQLSSGLSGVRSEISETRDRVEDVTSGGLATNLVSGATGGIGGIVDSVTGGGSSSTSSNVNEPSRTPSFDASGNFGDPVSPIREFQAQADKAVQEAGEQSRGLLDSAIETGGNVIEGAAIGGAAGSISPDPITTGIGAVAGGITAGLGGDPSRRAGQAVDAVGGFLGFGEDKQKDSGKQTVETIPVKTAQDVGSNPLGAIAGSKDKPSKQRNNNDNTGGASDTTTSRSTDSDGVSRSTARDPDAGLDELDPDNSVDAPNEDQAESEARILSLSA